MDANTAMHRADIAANDMGQATVESIAKAIRDELELLSHHLDQLTNPTGSEFLGRALVPPSREQTIEQIRGACHRIIAHAKD